jgi:polyphosphate kinase
LFIFFGFRVQPKKYKVLHFEHLLVAQFNLQSKLLELIEQEIVLAKQGKSATITIKLNSLEDKVLITKLYEASNAGVQIKLIVRSICCLVPGVANMSENISVLRIVDRYLEHGRVFIFGNNGAPLVFMGSADWMNKSMYYRIEVCFPVYDEKIKAEMMRLIAIQLADNVKAVHLNEQMQNVEITAQAGQQLVRSQKAIYEALKS